MPDLATELLAELRTARDADREARERHISMTERVAVGFEEP